MYAKVFRGESSLWQVRNRIVHGGLLVAPEIGAPLGYAGECVASQLSAVTPQREHLLRRLKNSA